MRRCSNKNLNYAKRVGNNEFYTLLPDIEKELCHYKSQLKSKIIYCNCDDVFESNFVKYFIQNFNELGLKRLIATSFCGDHLPLFEKPRQTFYTEINEVPCDDLNVETLIKREKNKHLPLKSDGDFRSDECVGFLKASDIVITNPPFELFREFFSQLIEHQKKFLIIGNMNAATCKDIFPHIKECMAKIGVSKRGMTFRVSNDYEIYAKSGYQDSDGNKYLNVPTAVWFTNLDVSNPREPIVLNKKYSPKEYPKYDNYDAIEVSNVKDIPYDYDGVMGVPVTFLEKYNHDQFAIVGMGEDNGRGYSGTHLGKPVWSGENVYVIIGGEIKFKRIFIKHKKIEIVGASEQCGTGLSNGIWNKTIGKHAYIDGNRKYSRIFIQTKPSGK